MKYEVLKMKRMPSFRTFFLMIQNSRKEFLHTQTHIIKCIQLFRIKNCFKTFTIRKLIILRFGTEHSHNFT